jgi:hypothetical protein
MMSFETETQVFVVRFWLETREIEGKKRIWRGVIEHLASGNRRYVKKPQEIISFLEQYRGKLETQQSPVQRASERLKSCWSRFFKKN